MRFISVESLQNRAAETIASHDRRSMEIVNARSDYRRHMEEAEGWNEHEEVYKVFDGRTVKCRTDHGSKKTRQKLGATVLDLFGGIGSGIVAAKQLGIAIDKYMYVDFDRVVRFAFAETHNPSFWRDPSLKDKEMQFVYIHSFDEIILETLVKDHGSVDLIFASPPFVDFTRINAYAQGIYGRSGRLTPLTVKLIKKVKNNRIQKATGCSSSSRT